MTQRVKTGTGCGQSTSPLVVDSPEVQKCYGAREKRKYVFPTVHSEDKATAILGGMRLQVAWIGLDQGKITSSGVGQSITSTI